MAKTVLEARALPLIDKADAKYDGEAKVKPLCVRRPDGSISLFLDTDGRVMKVVSSGKAEAKAPYQPIEEWGE